jgi:uncharacterized damage-inducible protein DinB
MVSVLGMLGRQDTLMTLSDFHELFAYNAWANSRACDSAATLTLEEFTRPLVSSFGSIRDTLAHIAAEEWIWLERAKGKDPHDLPSWAAAPALDVISEMLAKIHADRSNFLDALTADSLGRMLQFRSLEGHECRNRLGDVLMHMVNHSIYHRGQIATLMRQLGRVAPETDFVVYREPANPEPENP